jgi:hypothetical protein
MATICLYFGFQVRVKLLERSLVLCGLLWADFAACNTLLDAISLIFFTSLYLIDPRMLYRCRPCDDRDRRGAAIRLRHSWGGHCYHKSRDHNLDPWKGVPLSVRK